METIWKEIETAINKQEYDNVNNGCDKLIQQLSTSSTTALDDSAINDLIKCKVTSLIQLGHFNKALELMNPSNNNNNDNNNNKNPQQQQQQQQYNKVFNKVDKNAILKFEKAYCLYRLKRYQESLDVLNLTTNTTSTHNNKTATNNTTKRELILKAQVYYRLNRYSDALSIYNQMIIANKDEESNEELKSNAIAVATELKDIRTIQQCLVNNNTKSSSVADSSLFEMEYNIGCGYASVNDWKNAKQRISNAKSIQERMAKEKQQEEGTEETAEETSKIMTLEGFIAQMEGDKVKAKQYYQKAIKTTATTSSATGSTTGTTTEISAIISNNMSVINDGNDIVESMKKLKHSLGEEVKLTEKQKATVQLNHCLLILRSLNRKGNKKQQQQDQQHLHEKQQREAEGLKEAISKYKRNQFSDPEMIGLLEIMMMITINKISSSSSSTTTITSNEMVIPHDTTMFLKNNLAHAQMLINEGKIPEAIQVLERLPPNIRNRPGIAETMTNLLESQGRVEEAKQVMEQCAMAQETPMKIRREIASKLTKKGNRDSAMKIFEAIERIINNNPNDTIDPMQIEMLVQSNPSKAEQLCKRINPPSPLTSAAAVNVEKLENLPQIRSIETLISKPTVTTAATAAKKEKKNKKKKRLPKNFNPNIPPDPDRWKPKQERASYRPRKGKGRRGVDALSKGMQGTRDSATEASLNKVKTTAVEPSSSSSTITATTSTNRRRKHVKPIIK